MDNIMKRAMSATLYLIIICFVVWAIIPAWSTFSAGVVLGAAASAVNALLLRRRIDFLGQIAMGSGKRKFGIGTGSRIATILLVVMIAYHLPDHFSLIATLVACFFVQYFVWITALWSSIRNTRGKE